MSFDELSRRERRRFPRGIFTFLLAFTILGAITALAAWVLWQTFFLPV